MTRTRKSSAARAVPLQQSRSRSSNASSRQRAARSPAPVVLPALEPVSAREARLRQLGLSETMVHHAGKARPASRAMELLGARMEPVKLVQVPGAVMWVDFELARELGFSVPPDNRLTPELHHELIEALSFRVLGEGEQPGDRKVIEGGSERYAGTGQGDSLGAGRAAFLPVLNVNIKGVGRTPLAGPPDPDDYTHSHGGAPAREGLLEAIWGLEADNLFTNKGTRILAVIDTGDDTEWADGTREPRGLIARVGNQYRPAHVLEKDEPYWFKGADFTAPLFLEQARAAGILVEQNGRPDYAATMRNAVDRQALLTAQQFRNRILHGAVSTSNLEWDGGLLDHGTTTSVSRTEPAKVIDHGDAFGTEHTKRARELEYVYLELQAQLASGGGPGARSATPINFTSEMRKRYEAHLTVELLDATGFKPELSQALIAAEPALCRRYRLCLNKLAGLSAATKVNIDKAPAPDASTVDIFHLLAVLPEQLLANPELDFATAVREGLLVQGEEPEQLEGLLQTLAELYPQVMAAAIAHSGPFYDGEQAMQRSVAARAAFENRPIDRLQRAVLRDTLNAAIDEFRRSSRTTQVDSPAYAATIREAVDKTVAASVRSIEGLLASGRSRQLSEGVYELEGRTIDGIDYAVRAWDDGKRRLHLGIPLEGNDDDGYALPTLRVESEAQPPFLHRDQLDALAFRFTTDGWQNTQEVVAKVTIDESGRPVAEFDIPVLGGEAGMLEGLFHCTSRGDFWWHDGTSNFRGYTYAVPDRHELAGLAESLRPTGSVLDWQ